MWRYKWDPTDFPKTGARPKHTSLNDQAFFWEAASCTQCMFSTCHLPLSVCHLHKEKWAQKERDDRFHTSLCHVGFSAPSKPVGSDNIPFTINLGVWDLSLQRGWRRNTLCLGCSSQNGTEHGQAQPDCCCRRRYFLLLYNKAWLILVWGAHKPRKKKANFSWGNWSADAELTLTVCCNLMKKQWVGDFGKTWCVSITFAMTLFSTQWSNKGT